MLFYIINLTNYFINPPFQLFSAVCNLFRLTASIVCKSFNSLTIRKELDFKSEYLFRMCSVVPNLVTSLEFLANPLLIIVTYIIQSKRSRKVLFNGNVFDNVHSNYYQNIFNRIFSFHIFLKLLGNYPFSTREVKRIVSIITMSFHIF